MTSLKQRCYLSVLGEENQTCVVTVLQPWLIWLNCWWNHEPLCVITPRDNGSTGLFWSLSSRCLPSLYINTSLCLHFSISDLCILVDFQKWTDLYMNYCWYVWYHDTSICVKQLYFCETLFTYWWVTMHWLILNQNLNYFTFSFHSLFRISLLPIPGNIL